MNLSEICQKIKSLIAEIFTAHKELEEATETSYLKARNSVPLFVEAVKQVAPLTIKYYGRSLGYVGNKDLVWHEEFGIGVRISQKVEPLMISEGDFPVENLVTDVQYKLNSTLRNIQGKKAQVVQRTERLEQLIATLKEWEKESA